MSQAAHIIATSHRVHVGQGEHHVSRDPGVMLSTILGSCVAACIRDDRSGVGGMNHFLLAEGSGVGADAQRYGVHAMELLINEVLKAGGERGRLRAKLFGGARMFEDMKSIGDGNAAFAQKFLRDEFIPVDASSLGGRQARRIHYWPASGRVLMRLVEDAAATVGAAERSYAKRAPIATADAGDVELF
jgi:chemotaxis protein CheD